MYLSVTNLFNPSITSLITCVCVCSINANSSTLHVKKSELRMKINILSREVEEMTFQNLILMPHKKQIF